MAKPPQNLPLEGDRCKMRDPRMTAVGVVEWINPTNNWTRVRWDQAGTPATVHRYELEKIVNQQHTEKSE